jgi:alpha-galactosidase
MKLPTLPRRHVVAGLLIGPATAYAKASNPPRVDFHALAPTPPMGWNSWDSFGPVIDEAAACDNAAILAARLLPHGAGLYRLMQA